MTSMFDESQPRRPNTTTGAVSSTRSSSRRSLATSYLDLRPLPEDAMIEGSSRASFDTNDKSVTNSSWDEEGESIKRNVLSRLPSSKSLDGNDAKPMSPTSTIRPQTAPVGGDINRPFSREGLLTSSSSARSARYLAIQWRSRATQLSLSSKSLGDTRSVESPPSATRSSDDDSSESDTDHHSHSSDSDYSVETMDESIKSQVSDAQRVVEKWQQRWNERTDSMSLYSESASREEEEEERRTSHSSETHKACNIRPSHSGEDSVGSNGTREGEIPDGLHFALKPTPSQRALLTDENDDIEVESRLTSYPLQPVDSGRQFLSESQKHLGTFMEEDEEDSVDNDDDDDEAEEDMSESQTSHTSHNSVFVMDENGAVAELIEPSVTSMEHTVESVDGDTKTEVEDSVVTDDDHLSHASSSKAIDHDDELSEHSTTEQSAHVVVNKESYDTNLSFETQPAKKSIVNTFCEVPETFVPKPAANVTNEKVSVQPLEETVADENVVVTPPPPLEDTTVADKNALASSPCVPNTPQSTLTRKEPSPAQPLQDTVADENPIIIPSQPSEDTANVVDENALAPSTLARQESISPSVNDTDQTPKVKHSSRKLAEKIQNVQKVESPPSQSPKIVALKKKNTAYTGSVQERIDAVKKSREAARKKKSKGSSSSPKSPSRSKNRPRSAETKMKPKTDQVKIRWVEHDVVFTFGLLTGVKNAPPLGAYTKEDEESSSYKNKLKTRSKLLYDIMSNFGEIIRRTKSLGNGSTKYMMCSPDCTPRPLMVRHDNQFKAPANRPRIRRCVVKATVPIFVPKGDVQAKEVATHVVLDLFAVAISKGEFDGLIFEKVG